MYRLILVAVLLLSTACPYIAADTVLTGRVLTTDRLPIADVVITSADIDGSARTDSTGTFLINIAENISSLNLTFSHVGYIPKTINHRLDNSSPEIIMEQQFYPMKGITVTAGRAIDRVTPVPHANLDPADIDLKFDFGEVPELLELTPNLYSFSDAGDGLGYSYIKMRGFDHRRTPVYINGIPLNDPEDHSLYFVDLPDLSSEADNIQVQRGVGNALYADPAFGGSINILTSPIAREQKFEIALGYGGFWHDGEQVGIKRKQTASYSSGIIGDGWAFSGNYVRQFSDGYREKSWYEGNAYYLSIARLDPGMITTMNIYSGPMTTHAAWWGLTRAELAENRRANPYNYINEVDNFEQPHFELHNIWTVNSDMIWYNTLYHIRGVGYYEQFIPTGWDDLFNYSLTDTTAYSDLIRRKQVEKGQWGFTSRLELEREKHKSAVGASYYYFDSEHWGEALWAEELDPSILNYDKPYRYFTHYGKINDLSGYLSHTHYLTDRLLLSGSLQAKYRSLDVHQPRFRNFEGHRYGIDWFYLSPSIGATYLINDAISTYASFAVSNQLPFDDLIDDTDDHLDMPRLEQTGNDNGRIIYGDPIFDNEKVYDIELGADYKTPQLTANLNLFWMEYHNEVVPDGGVNDDGFPTYGNADRSVHRGIELAAGYQILPGLRVDGHYSFNDNLIKEYDQFVGDSVIEHRDVTVPGFPKYMGNLSAMYTIGAATFLYQLRVVGRQMAYLTGRFDDIGGELVDVSVAPYTLSSIKGVFKLGQIFGAADISLEARIDNLFNEEYLTNAAYYYGEYYYWVGAERNWFVNIKMSI